MLTLSDTFGVWYWKWKIEPLYGYVIIVRVSDVYVGDHEAGRVLGLTASAYIRRVGTAPYKQGKGTKFTFGSTVSAGFILLAYHHAVKKSWVSEVGTVYLLQ